ncbi:HlyIII-domain-containing protein [Dendrothele bispora CBS 962.96]|uniref:HlyIII-domain-containing protein n=1 Tax=Dendrothele bispora (strain CBS 962.96) TaxID=1314807 RepID=A0A4S8MNY2_DENBC|nr:HlyIII-domain-containing protein [Dendrothele bispora CBS 962.96]
MSTLRRRTKSLTSTVSEASDAVVNTIHWLELPEWQRDNEYILSGYRRVQNHWKGCFHSVYAYLHNETVNIHSHLWGGILFLYLFATVNSTSLISHPTSWTDSVMFSIFLLSAVFCLLASALYHTLTCHSQEVAARCHAFDYSGIVVLTVGSFYPCLYYGFYCEPHLQILYILAISIVGAVAAYIVLNPEYAKPTHRGARTAVFIVLGLCAAVPVTHWALVHGMHKLVTEMGLQWLALSGSLYIFGALLYANRIPERFFPGAFDYFFASHQIFHFCVVLAALAHYTSIKIALDHAYTHISCV